MVTKGDLKLWGSFQERLQKRVHETFPVLVYSSTNRSGQAKTSAKNQMAAVIPQSKWNCLLCQELYSLTDLERQVTTASANSRTRHMLPLPL